MPHSENRALAWAAAVLLATSVARLAWGRLTHEVVTSAAEDPAPEMLSASREALADAEARARPLAPGERVDPNRATAAELDRLPGVGPATAEAVVRSRERDGPFRSAGDLARVRGIGSATVEKIAPLLDLSAPPVAGARGGGAPPRAGPLVDVNRATEEELRALPGVGPALARRIVEARRSEPFRSIADLERVRGIGPATLARLEGSITVRPR